jgi:uncharacterized protein YeeX (DUF496 family)
MAKLLSGKTRITIDNEYQGVSIYDAAYVSISSMDKGKTYNIVTDTAKQVPTPRMQGGFPSVGLSKEEQSAKLVEQHTGVILDVLKAAETARLNSALKRERFEEAEAALARADRAALTLAVHNAIQAGVDMEEVTAEMRDDHAGYVADMVIKVYEDTDLDTVVNVS